MAVAQYYAWDRDGRPLSPAQPVRDIVNRMNAAYPAAAAHNLFSWYADEAHYQAEPPQDHTPYSYTGWPLRDPYPVVCATDIMHRPDLGVNCFNLFDYWIVQARAGAMPWCKYLIWQGWIYDVRENWAPRAASDHYDHIHISTRTDHINTSLGSWSLTPGGPTSPEDDMITVVEDAAAPGTYYLWNGQTFAHLTGNINDVGFVLSGRWPTGNPDGAYGTWMGKVVINARTGAAPWLNIPTLPIAVLAVDPQAVAGLELTAEELAALTEAARAGAEAGAPSHEELEQAAFEGSQRAEDS